MQINSDLLLPLVIILLPLQILATALGLIIYKLLWTRIITKRIDKAFASMKKELSHNSNQKDDVSYFLNRTINFDWQFDKESN